MMSPRSFLVSRQSQLHPHAQTHLSSGPSFSAVSSSSSSSASTPTPTALKRKDDRTPKSSPTPSISSSDIISAASSMAASSNRRETDARPSPVPNTAISTVNLTRPPTPTGPVQIPIKSKSRETAHPHKHTHRHHGDRRHHLQASPRPKDVHSPDAIPPSVAALLAITSIPPSKGSRSLRTHGRNAPREKRMTVESIIERSQESEKELSLTLGRGPLDLLLSAPEDLEVDDVSLCDSNLGSTLSTRTVSLESMPSLGDSFTTETLSSVETPFTPARRRKSQITRRSLEPVSSPPGELEDHPLSAPEVAVDDLDFRIFEKPEIPDKKASRLRPLKTAFKSNLTASLRALRQAARSFSTLNFPSIPPEDFLTRSILTIDPQVPFTDERRPPLEEEPTAELRRYLNPTTAARLERPSTSHGATANGAGTTRAFTASIQMQTYRVQKARSAAPSSGHIPYPTVGPTADAQFRQSQDQRSPPQEFPAPGPRQREMRENSDFIRIAVMEMAMRKLGKLDDKRPGRARWALPPRKASTRPYDVGPNGVPTRWVAMSC